MVASADVRRVIAAGENNTDVIFAIVRVFGMWLLSFGIAGTANGGQAAAQPPPQPAQPPLFLHEAWKEPGKERAVSAHGLSSPNLELRFYDPYAKNIPTYSKNPPVGSRADDWDGASCIMWSGTQATAQIINLWTGICTGPVAATLRDKSNYVDLTGFAKIRWVTRVSGFHVVRPVIKLADGTWLIGDHADGETSTNSTVFLESEFPIASVRWLKLDISRVATRGTWVEKPDLSKVDEVGFADLMSGSGHGWGGFVGVGTIEVYGAAVKR